MTDRIWHNGPPPHVGWWLCSSDWWRWWDGVLWSHGVRVGSTLKTRRKAAQARCGVLNSQEIRWSDYWPADARVPRLDTTDGHWTFNTTGERPKVEGLVEVVLRDGARGTTSASRLHWELTSLDWGLVAWRPAK